MSAKDLLQKLVAVPSVNPAFEAEQDSWLGEAQLTDVLQSLVEERGWPWLRQEVHPGRENLITLLPPIPGQPSTPVTLWEVHQDTVGVSAMEVPPFAGEVHAGKLFGRGACDVKGGMAAMLTACCQVAAAQQRQGTVLLAFTINEECGFSGAKALCRLWDHQQSASDAIGRIWGTIPLVHLRELRPQRAIVAEPTDLEVVVAHKGIARWQCVTHGKSAHTSQPQAGHNAIYAMTEVVTAIRQFDEQVLTGRGATNLCGRPTVSVNMIHGGTGANVVPDRAVIDIDRRLMPGEEPQEAIRELSDFVSHQVSDAVQVEHCPPWNTSFGLEPEQNLAWAKEIASKLSTLQIGQTPVGVPYGTDAWVIASLGIPVVVFGPGSIDQAHTDDEWISVEQLDLGVEAYAMLAMS